MESKGRHVLDTSHARGMTGSERSPDGRSDIRVPWFWFPHVAALMRATPYMSSLRKQGPIPRDLSWTPFKTIAFGGYGSLLSQGRRSGGSRPRYSPTPTPYVAWGCFR